MSLGEAEQVRVERLPHAQTKTEALFEEIDRRQIIIPGVRKSEASNAIRDLATDLSDASRHRHKRIVRSGPNTLLPYRENPPDRVIEDDDIAFADFLPIFEAWEADFGRTFALCDPVKHQLRDALPELFEAGRNFFSSSPRVSGAQIYARVTQLGEDTGWEFGG